MALDGRWRIYYYERWIWARGKQVQAIEFVDPSPTHTACLTCRPIFQTNRTHQFSRRVFSDQLNLMLFSTKTLRSRATKATRLKLIMYSIDWVQLVSCLWWLTRKWNAIIAREGLITSNRSVCEAVWMWLFVCCICCWSAEIDTSN